MGKDLKTKQDKLIYLEELLKKDRTSNTKKLLAQKLNVDIKTVYNYITALREKKCLVNGVQYPIEIGEGRIGKETYYYYKNVSLSIKNDIISKEDLAELKEFQALIKTKKSIQNLLWIQTLNTRLKQSIDHATDEKNTLETIVFFDEPKKFDERIQQYIDLLYKCIRNAEVIKIGYQGFNKNKKFYNISPYFIKEHKHMWYVYGFNHDSKAKVPYPCLALDRILSIEVNHEKKYYPKSKTINPETWFKHNLGITINENLVPIPIELKVDQSLMNYLKNTPIDESQIIIEHDSTITVKLVPNYELEQWILGYGEQIEVLKPDFLREKIKSRILKQFEKYQ